MRIQDVSVIFINYAIKIFYPVFHKIYIRISLLLHARIPADMLSPLSYSEYVFFLPRSPQQLCEE